MLMPLLRIVDFITSSFLLAWLVKWKIVFIFNEFDLKVVQGDHSVIISFSSLISFIFFYNLFIFLYNFLLSLEFLCFLLDVPLVSLYSLGIESTSSIESYFGIEIYSGIELFISSVQLICSSDASNVSFNSYC